MIGAWMRAHQVTLVVLIATLGSVVLLLAGSTSFAAPRQPIPLIWPVASIIASGSLLALNTGFGSQLVGAVRAVLDRFLAVCLVLGVMVVLLCVGALVDLPLELRTWMIAVAAVGMGAAALGASEAWAASMLVGLLGVGLEFTTPLAPISTLVEGPRSAVGWAAAFLSASAAYIVLSKQVLSRIRLGSHLRHR